MTLQEIFEMLTQPNVLIIYIAIIIVVVVGVIFSIMRNEHWFNRMLSQMQVKTKKAEQIKQEKKEEKKVEENKPRFPELTKYDQEKTDKPKKEYDEKISLEDFCNEFRAFAAGRTNNPLYYDISVIREFVAGLAASRSHILILQGLSGTGKTSLAYVFGEFIGNSSKNIPVQPMWKERTDLLGYYNEFTKQYNETPLLLKMYEANDSEDMYIVILDELNIARVEYYFAEFLSQLEMPAAEMRKIKIISPPMENDPKGIREGEIKVPENMWFIGTANNDDSTFAISDKVYDRAMILDMNSKTESFPSTRTTPIPIRAKRFMELARIADHRDEPEEVRDQKIKPGLLDKLKEFDKYMIKTFQITFGNRIMEQIKSYLLIYEACGGEQIDALDDIIAKKVLRKLDMLSALYVQNQVDSFLKALEAIFEGDEMKRCKAYIQKFKNAK